MESLLVARLLLIGTLQEHSEICAKEGSDEIIVFYTDDPDLEPNTFPSIYHLICGIDRGDIC